MKTKITLLALFLTFLGFTQNGINYKAVIKDEGGNIVANELIQVQFSVLENATTVYTESHVPTTDENGIVIVNIGEGTPIMGTFDTIDWAADDHLLNVQVNIGGGLTDLGTTPFNAVPYSISAEKASDMELDDLTNVTGTPSNGEVLKFNGANWVPGTDDGVWSLNGTEAYYSGRVGIGVTDPEDFARLHVGGDLFVQTNLGEMVLGFPNNGNQWQFSTSGSGSRLQLASKPSASNTFTRHFMFEQDGEFKIGQINTTEAWMHIQKNSTINKMHLLLEEEGNDYARIGFENTSVANSDWQIAALPSTSTTTARVNFYFRNADGAGNKMTLLGNGKLGVNGTPSSRLHVYQAGQSVGLGLAFNDGTANQDWDITHGFGLRFHYGSTLKGLISATTGAYVQGSDIRLKENINELNPVLDKVLALDTKSYTYRADTTKKKSIGVIAQEVQQLFPEVVYYSEVDDTYGVNYSAFGVIAIKAIQEQQTRIENQQKQIDELKALVQRQLNKN
ncbi:tail fiber domain-containing protein [Winogradskyella bathintestinalis]|uniref:Tail fiber domain-containing protein n=1 Tax=Winogradskyella bathintestinalis TaxID=3035208 RepID=A0ABT7ZWS3_9FLAO|nr:tail fiber domain-containing protein [Winogradskyella bathintestinalis]MDN3493457.1 tail fiber domain-containing protein [Winogradskyella bathintestinalis]